ncbi:MAG: hypothetical protein A3K10_05160 [Bacteroidetes bacterium RIFCSPLOWO2_12_FULL_31_6]|nr:MAG: hypothetical protein A3K10_05160 [Bacteroidetes bacterium RIFCSPLOWO2_12_FULL_31_6]
MSIPAKKLGIIEYLIRLQDESLLNQFEKLIKRVGKTAPKLTPMTMEEFYARIEDAEKDVREGKYQTQAEVEKESENW